MRLRSDRRYRLPLTPGEVWARVSSVDEYPSWWPWLRAFDGADLVAGAMWSCEVRPPLPYSVRFVLTVGETVPERSVAATVRGDIVGTAMIEIEPQVDGSEVHLVADLGPDNRALRMMSVAARPLVRFGHDWVLDTAARQFARVPGTLPTPLRRSG